MSYETGLISQKAWGLPEILQDVLPSYYIIILLKRARVVKFRHPREHPELNIHWRHFDRQTIIDSNMRNARSNKLKSKTMNSLLSVQHTLHPLPQTTTTVPVFEFSFSLSFTHSRFWSLCDKYIPQVPSHLLSCCLFHSLSHSLSMLPLSYPHSSAHLSLPISSKQPLAKLRSPPLPPKYL